MRERCRLAYSGGGEEGARVGDQGFITDRLDTIAERCEASAEQIANANLLVRQFNVAQRKRGHFRPETFGRRKLPSANRQIQGSPGPQNIHRVANYSYDPEPIGRHLLGENSRVQRVMLAAKKKVGR